MATKFTYPLVPKSTASLRPGQYWAVPLSDGRFACGRVVQIGCPAIPSPTRAFFGGLHDWIGSVPPSADAIAGRPIVEWGVMHLRAITKLGGAILGERDLGLDAIAPPARLSSMGGSGTLLLNGAEPVRVATRDEWGTIPALGFWGYDFIQQLAEARMVQRRSR